MRKFALKFMCTALAVALCATAFTGCNRKFSGDKLAIGGIGPLTGSAADYGTAVRNAIELAIEEVNAAGGVNGIELELIFEDDVATGTDAVNAYNSLKNAGMQLLIGTVTSGSGIAISEYTRDDNVFVLSPSGSDNGVIQYDNAFRVCLADEEQGTKAAEYILEYLPEAQTIGILSSQASSYSQGITTAFKNTIGTQRTLVEQTFANDDVTDFRAQARALNDAGVDLVFLPIYYRAAAAFIQEAQNHARLREAIMIGGDGLDGIIQQLGGQSDLAEDVLLVTLFSATSTEENVVNFVTKYQERFSNVPSQFAADAYDAVYIVKQALEYAVEEQGKSFDASTSASDLCEILKAAIVEIEFKGVTTYDAIAGTDTIRWNESGAPSDRAVVVKISDGKYVNVGDASAA